MSFETEAFQDHVGNELQLERIGPPFSSLTPVPLRSKNNQQLTVFVSFNRTVWYFYCRVSSTTKDDSVRILKYSFGYLKIDFGFPKKSILFACYFQELSNHVHCTWHDKSINKWVEGRERLSPLSRLICEILNSAGQGNFTFVREKSGNFGNLWMWKPWVELTLTRPL